MHSYSLYFFSVILIIVSGCSSSIPTYDSPNYNKNTGRFQHPNGNSHNKRLTDLAGFAYDYFTRENDEFEKKGFPVIYSSRQKLSSFQENVIWVGHATILLNHKGLTILTDPHFSGRASPFDFWGPKRATPTPFAVTDLPKIDVVLISHNHYDHLDKKSITQLARLQPQVKFLVPLGLKSLLLEWGAKNVRELDWWQSIKIEGAAIQPTPVQHWSKRSTSDRNKTLWAGWMVKWSRFSFYFAGDTGYSDDFRVTAQKLGSPTLAAIPIGAYEPRDFMKTAHVNPEEAVKVFRDLGAKYAIGIHWGTFKLTLESMDEPPRRLESTLRRQNMTDERFKVMTHGEDWPEVFIR